MRTIRSFNEFTWSLIIFFILSMYASAINAEETPQSDWVKGCVVIGSSNQHHPVFRPFIKTGIADDDPDNGEEQILGYEPGNVVIHNGTVVYERVKKASFLSLHEHKPISGMICTCPPYDE